MQSQRVFAIRLIAGAIAAAPLWAAPLPEDQQWQCGAAPAGGWSCRAVPRPQGDLAPAPRPSPAPDAPVPEKSATPATPAAQNVPAQPATPPTATAPVDEPAPADESAPADQPAIEPEPEPATPSGRAERMAPEPLATDLDWVEQEEMDAAHVHKVPAHCGGTYVEPVLPPLRGKPLLGTVHASSDETELLQDADIAHFRGNVSVRQDDRRLRADQATYYRTEQRVEIAGHVQYREPGLLVQGEKASFRTEEESGELDDARFVMHREHARGEAERVLRNPDRSIDLENGTYTHCEPGRNDWAISSRTIHLDRETGQGTARNATLKVKDVPVLYTPYIRFPIDDRRQSGFLWPEFTNSSQNGLDLATPYYFNLAPNYDATVVPRYLVDRGPMAGGEARYLDRFGMWVASGAYMPDDDVSGDSRWLASLQQNGSLPHAVMTSINYTEVSDEEYLRNLGATGLDVKRATHLAQAGAVRWMPLPRWTVQALAQQYQLLDDELVEPYKILPRLAMTRALGGEPFQFDYTVNAEYTAFEHKDNTFLTGQRLYLEPMMTYPMEWPAAFVRPTLGYRSINYNLSEDFCNPSLPAGSCGTGNESPSVAAPLFSLDSGYFLERNTRWFGTDILQTLEPRAYYLWVDNEDHGDIPNFDSLDLTFSFSQLFRSTRFAGRDRIADANQLSFSVTSRVIDDESGLELLTASVGEIRYFANRRVTIANVPGAIENQSTSALAAELKVQPDARISVTGSTLFDPREEQVDEGGVFMHWTPDAQTIVNLGYRYRREQPFVEPTGLISYADIDQVDFSTAVPISQHWKLLARYQYDFTNDQDLEQTAGVEYSACCWALRMVYQEGLDWDQGKDYGFYLEFVLRGLGGIGRNIDQLLQKSIFGYGEYERDYRVAE